nr:uncharacterized protein LOC111517773 [Leptinotarsa decemlineata]
MATSLRMFFNLIVITVFCIGLNTVTSQNDQKKGKADGKEFECPQSTGNGNYADPATCKRFYQLIIYLESLNVFQGEQQPIFGALEKYTHFLFINDAPSPVTETPTDLATKCDPAKCQLPYCFCSKDGTIVPGNLDPEEIPQMIVLTLDGAVNLNNYDHYRKVFNHKRKNPNGCEIKGTFFISHEYSNYHMIQELASEGHEIGTETISLQTGLENKGYEEWVGEMVGMRDILKHLSNISKSEVVGMRAPFLKPGRNTQYKVLEEFGYIYDSSIGVPALPIPVWPYTLDYKIPHECKSGTCPTKSFPGVWEVPLNTHYVEGFEGGHCPYLDQCVLHNHDGDDVFEWLQEDFLRYYDQNRAPYMMPFHTNWFSIKELEQGLHKFLNWVQTLDDVWFVTITQALTWITDPKTVSELNKYEPWDCKKENLPPKPCNLPNKCALSFKRPEWNFTDTRYLETCNECPKQYPWLDDASGSGIPGKDNYVPDNVRK